MFRYLSNLKNRRITQPIFLLAFHFFSHNALAIELKGNIGGEARWFTELDEAQISAAGELELYWEEGNNSLTAQLFARIDDTDDERTHGDIRELMWLHYANNWELRAGIGKVFWGVTESAHRVDIINQTDLVESPDGEQKLGQPMIHFTSLQNWGTLDAFILPYFRERTFDGPDGYLTLGLPVDSDNASYRSSKKEQHIDWALRYSHTLGYWDLGLSHFSGTSREPLLIPVSSASLLTGQPQNQPTQTQLTQTPVALQPFYDLIEQTGLDAQATLGAWLWKLEAIYQTNNIEDFSAVTGGFEYTVFGILGSIQDLGLLVEVHHDSRGQDAPSFLQNDLFLGARLAFNNTADTSILVGVSQDLDYSASYSAFIEGSQRVGDNWVFTLDGRLFTAEDPQELGFVFREKDHITLDATYYF